MKLTITLLLSILFFSCKKEANYRFEVSTSKGIKDFSVIQDELPIESLDVLNRPYVFEFLGNKKSVKIAYNGLYTGSITDLIIECRLFKNSTLIYKSNNFQFKATGSQNEWVITNLYEN